MQDVKNAEGAVSTERDRQPRESGPVLVQALSRGLGILSQFTAESRSLSLAELSRRTGLHRATVYRFVKTLEAEDYLTYNQQSGLYSVGPAWAAALYSLGSDTVFAEILNEDLHRVTDMTQETVALGVRRGDNVQILRTLAPSRAFVPKLPDSNLTPLHASWSVHAKIHLAYSTEDTQRRMLAVPQTRYTEYTVTEPPAIRTRLEEIANEGIAYDLEEHRLGVCAIAVPVLSGGKVLASLGLVIPVERFTTDTAKAFGEQLREAASSMGTRLSKAADAWGTIR